MSPWVDALYFSSLGLLGIAVAGKALGVEGFRFRVSRTTGSHNNRSLGAALARSGAVRREM